MKRVSLILLVLFSFISCIKAADSNISKSPENSEAGEQLISIIKSILEGKDNSEIRKNISPEAYVINNNTYESIFEILSNPSKKKKFVYQTECKIEFIHLLISDGEKDVYMVVKTKHPDDVNSNWHSILFKADENHKWQIYSWHKS